MARKFRTVRQAERKSSKGSGTAITSAGSVGDEFRNPNLYKPASRSQQEASMLLASVIPGPVGVMGRAGRVGLAGKRAAEAAAKAKRVKAPKGMASREALRAQRASDIRAAGATRRTANTVPKDSREVRSLMRPGNAPRNRPVIKPEAGGLRSGNRDQRALSSKVETRNIGPKPKRADYKTQRGFDSATKKWNAKRDAPTSTPAAAAPRPKVEAKKPSAKPASTPKAKDVAVKQDAAAASRGSAKAAAPKKPSAKKKDKAPSSKGKELVPARQAERGSSGARSGKPEREPIDLKTRPVPGTGGSSQRAIGSGAGGRDVAVRAGSTVVKRPRAGALAVRATERKAAAAGGGAAGIAGKIGKAATAGALLGGGLAFLNRENDKSSSTAKPPAPSSAKPSSTVKDKYGRKISREEYSRREKFRQKLAGAKSKADVDALRKAEGKRRASYRSGEGATQFGDEAKVKVKNKNVRGWVSVRDENRAKRARREGVAYNKSRTRRFG